MFSALGAKGFVHWLPNYLFRYLLKRDRGTSVRPKHIIVCIVDHFEPFNGGVSFDVARQRIKKWSMEYPKLAGKHIDSDGRYPQHCWFYPPHHDISFLSDLLELCKNGYGEIEMHLHHNRMDPFPDTAVTLKAKIMKCIEDYSKLGIFCLPDGAKRFGFIHGDWSLDNSRGSKICGVNNELSVLRECGCYADFTFPSLGAAQPATINSIYYARGNQAKAKAYNLGRELRVGTKPWGDLLIIQGIIGLRWKSRTHRFFPSVESSNLDKADYPSPERVDYWVKNGIRISGRPDWVLVKLHTHGAREDTWDSLLGKKAEEMFRYLEEKYNDGRENVLHYVTAREMFNIVKAAEAGKSGNPNLYRDFEIPQYTYLDRNKT